MTAASGTDATATDAVDDATATADQADKKSLEDTLASLDEKTRAFVLGEVTSARSEAKNLRTRVKEAEARFKGVEPDLAELNQLREASKTAEQRAQEAAAAAEKRAQDANLRVAKAEVKAALAAAGVDNSDAIVKRLDLKQFLDSDGEIDTEAVDGLKQEYAAFAGSRAPKPDPSQGSGANGKTAATPAAEFAAFLQQQIRKTG